MSWSSVPAPAGTSPRSARRSSARRVGVVEEKYWGGVCLNVGCIPSKALLRNAEIAHIITHEKKTFGIEGDATMAYGPTFQRSRSVADASAKGVHYLMKKNKITEIDGWGTLTGDQGGKHGVSVDKDGSTSSYTADNVIIGAGAKVRMLPGMSVSDNVVTYEEQILDENLPGSIIIGGSGAIGVEFAYVMTNFGVDVTIVEFLDRMVPTEDADVSEGAASPVQEARREGAALHEGRERRGHRQRASRSP